MQKLIEVFCQVEVDRGIPQEDEILFGLVIALLPIIVELQHRRHVAGAALLILPIRQTSPHPLPLLLLLLKFLQLHSQPLLLRLLAHEVIVVVLLTASGTRHLVVQTADESSQYLQRGIDVVVDVGMGGVEPDHQQIIHPFIVQQKQP